MATISQIQINGTTYEIADATARDILSSTNSVTIDDPSVITPESGITISSCWGLVWAETIAQFYIQFQSSSATTAGAAITVGTLPVDYRPKIEVGTVAGRGEDTGYIWTTGEVKYWSAGARSANGNLYIKTPAYLIK